MCRLWNYTCLLLGLLIGALFLPTSSSAQSLEALRAELPLDHIEKRSFSDPGDLSVSKTFTLDVRLDERASISLTTEYWKLSSFPKPLANELGLKPAWRFRAVPVTVGYNYALTPRDRRVVPIVGVGVSLYACESKKLAYADDTIAFDAEMTEHGGYHTETHRGLGYGAEASLGLRADLSNRLYVQTSARARYVRALAFAGADAEDSAAFKRLDVAVGVGFKF